MALYVIRARESGHYLEDTVRGPVSLGPDLWRGTRTYDSVLVADRAATELPFACDVLELRPVYREAS